MSNWKWVAEWLRALKEVARSNSLLTAGVRVLQGMGGPQEPGAGRTGSGSQSLSHCPSQEQGSQGANSLMADPLWDFWWSAVRELISWVTNFADNICSHSYSWNQDWGVAAASHGSSDWVQLPKHGCLVPIEAASYIWDICMQLVHFPHDFRELCIIPNRQLEAKHLQWCCTPLS